jgi:3-methyladenine DNA glycosylase/8-oxoguanine DNA glycosylase
MGTLDVLVTAEPEDLADAGIELEKAQQILEAARHASEQH